MSTPQAHNDRYAQPPHPIAWLGWALTLIAAGTTLHFSDHHQALMIYLNHLASVIPDVVWGCLTVTGLGWSVLILISVMHRHDIGARLAITGFVLGSIITHATKLWLQQPRPGQLIPHDSLHFIGSPVINQLSMPSGHSVAAFCLASLWVCLLRIHNAPRWLEGAAWSLATLIAASRIAVGAHWPADVLVGAGVGLFVGWTAWRFPLAWPKPNQHAFPWLALVIESIGGFAALTFDEGMPVAQTWQTTLGAIAILSIGHRLLSAWRHRPIGR